MFFQSEGMREFEEEDALTVAKLEAGVRCKWSWSWLKLESKCDVKGKEYVFTFPSCGSVVEHCVSSAKCCRLNSQGKRILTKRNYNLNVLSRFG